MLHVCRSAVSLFMPGFQDFSGEASLEFNSLRVWDLRVAGFSAAEWFEGFGLNSCVLRLLVLRFEDRRAGLFVFLGPCLWRDLGCDCFGLTV